LIHEVYLRLVDTDLQWRNRGHFLWLRSTHDKRESSSFATSPD
jgi:hypothetical protein